MANFFWAVGASIAVSLISLIGIFSLLFREERLHRLLILLIGFSAGGLIGGAFLHLLPEALDEGGGPAIFLYLISGFVAFFVLERYLHWRHCHEGVCLEARLPQGDYDQQLAPEAAQRGYARG